MNKPRTFQDIVSQVRRLINKASEQLDTKKTILEQIKKEDQDRYQKRYRILNRR